jgi:hypothetical protein
MDSFLTKIYEEEVTKQAGADMEHYLADLPVETLLKIAVGGPPLPELPDSAAGSRLDKKQKFIAEYVNKAHLSEVPDRKASGVASKVNFDGEGKEPESNVDEALRFSGSNGQTKKASGLTKECSATAQEKAKIAMRAINVTRGASPLIKHAAAALAGRSIADMGKGSTRT